MATGRRGCHSLEGVHKYTSTGVILSVNEGETAFNLLYAPPKVKKVTVIEHDF